MENETKSGALMEQTINAFLGVRFFVGAEKAKVKIRLGKRYDISLTIATSKKTGFY